MPRLIKRYGSRKLYDPAAGRYVTLDELAALVRGGEEVHVVENASGEDVTPAVLAQVLSDESRRGTGLLSGRVFHELIRLGESALRAGEGAVGQAVGTAVGTAVGALEGAGLSPASLRAPDLKPLREGAAGLLERASAPLRGSPLPPPLGEMRAEVDRLRERLEALERSLADLDAPASPEAAGDGAQRHPEENGAPAAPTTP